MDTLSDYYYIGFLAGEIDGECTISNCHSLSGNYKITAKDDGAGIDSSQTVVLGGLVGTTTCKMNGAVTF